MHVKEKVTAILKKGAIGMTLHPDVPVTPTLKRRPYYSAQSFDVPVHTLPYVQRQREVTRSIVWSQEALFHPVAPCLD